MKKNNYIRISLGFAGFTREQLLSFAVLLLVCLKNNVLFPNLPVKYADLETLVNGYQQAMAAATIGGVMDTALLDEAYDALVVAIRKTAGYIQSLGLTNASDVLSSGFDIILPGKNPQSPRTTPVVGLDNSVTCQLGVDIGAVPNAKAYHVQYAIGDGPMIDLGIFPNTRNIVIPNTVPGKNYSVRAQAVGGSTLYSSWSAVVTVMSM
jgi:hypothetical protein